MTRTVASFEPHPGYGSVVLDDGRSADLAWVWLRDNADDAASVDPRTRQRMVVTSDIAVDIAPSRVERRADGSAVDFVWPDGVRTSSSAELFSRAIGVPAPALTLWGADREPELTRWAWHELATDPATLVAMLDQLAAQGVALVSGVEPTEAGARAVAARLGYPRRTVFGDVWELAADLADHLDSAYGTEALGLHTDGTYAADAPGFQAFLCVERTGAGGLHVLTDGAAVVDRLRASDPASHRVLTDVAVTGRYIEPGVHLRATRPPIRLDDAGGFVQLSVNNFDREPTAMAPDRAREFHIAWSALEAEIADPRHHLEIEPIPGHLLVFDNWRVCHGRTPFTGRRRFHGFYLNREDVESTRRVALEAR